MTDQLQRNIVSIAQLERAALEQRPLSARVSGAVAGFAGTMTFVLLHGIWIALWLVLNRSASPLRFDPFPHSILILMLSFEAILLSTFVLMSQNQLAKMSDRRAQLNLQISLLAESEMTKMLDSLRTISMHLGLPDEAKDAAFRDLAKEVHVEHVAQALDEQAAAPARPSVAPAAKIAVLVLVALALAAPCMAQAKSEAPPKPQPVLNDEQLFRKYMVSTFGAPGALNATMAAGLNQWQDDPPEWGSGKRGYTKRWASSFAEQAIGNTTTYTVARLLHHDPAFTRCQCKGFAPRLRHALISPFTARTRRGRTVLSPAIVAGLAAEGILPAATWYPAPHGTVGGIGHAALSVVSKMGVDVLREFVRPPRWPKR